MQKNQKSDSFRVCVLGSNAPGHMFHPGQTPEFKFQIENLTDRKLDIAGHIDIIRYAQIGVPGDQWFPKIKVLDDAKDVPFKISLKPRGWKNAKVTVPLPKKKGGYALILDLGKESRRYLAKRVPLVVSNIKKEVLHDTT